MRVSACWPVIPATVWAKTFESQPAP
jgi:hypothetical protein